MKRITRRAFVTTLGTAAAGTLVADALHFGPRGLEVTRHDVPIPGLPPGAAGLRIAAVTDLHLGSVPAAARATLELLAREAPDIVVFVGDSCNKARTLDEFAAFARDARGRLATLATYGNWERWAGIEPGQLARVCEAAGVQLLVNESVVLTPAAAGGRRLVLVGFDDPTAGHPDIQASTTRASDDPQIWLVHSPGWVDRLANGAGIRPPSLILAGHTHGGQIRAPFWTPYTPWGSGRFVSGWYRDTFAPLYVSRGIVELHGGKIWCESNGPGTGTRFTVSLAGKTVPSPTGAPDGPPLIRRVDAAPPAGSQVGLPLLIVVIITAALFIWPYVRRDNVAGSEETAADREPAIAVTTVAMPTACGRPLAP